MAPLPTGTVAFLFTDVEGSTKRWQAHGAAMGAAIARHDALLRQEIERHEGYVFKTVGDAFCAAFPTTHRALAAALAAQRALAAEAWGEPGPLRVRMAIHVGAAEERDDDYFGPAVNRVARLLSAGHGGQVLLSLPAAELVRDGLLEGATLRDLGEHRLKDLARPERIFQFVVPDLPADFPALATLDGRPNNLPLQLTPFVGREREIAHVRERLERPDVRMVTLTGPGGTGKTRLSLQVAAELIETYANGAWFVELEEITEEQAVVAAVARALGVRETAGRSLHESILEHLASQHLLLVFDNFEQVAHAAPFVSSLLLAASQVQALVSSRVRLGIRGEHEYQVPPLGLPPRGLRPASPDDLVRYEAVRLFVDRAHAAKADFALTTDNAADVVQICRDLDGLPLAIELAAARIRLLPRALLKRLEDKLRLLVGGGSDRPERQQTLRAAIAWSHDLLPAEQQILFARLSIFAGGWSFEGAEAVTNPDGDLDLLEGLGALVDQSLIRQEETMEGEPRFSMLATIRSFASEQLAAAGDGEAELTARLHAEYFLALAEQAAPHLRGPEQASWLERLETEHDDLRIALGWFIAARDAEAALRLAAALGRFWFIRGYLSEGRGWLEQVNELGAAADAHLRAQALDAQGLLVHYLGDYDRAFQLHNQALALYEQVGDRNGMATALGNLGSVSRAQGKYDNAASSYAESMAIYREIGDRLAEGRMLNNLGALAFAQGHLEEAAAHYEQALAATRTRGDAQAEAVTLANLAETRHYQGDLERASSLYEEALPLMRRIGDKGTIAFVLSGLGRLALELGNRAKAKEYLNENLILNHEIGEKTAIAETLEGLAWVAATQAEPAQAARLFGAAEALFEETGAALQAAYRLEHDRRLADVRAALDHELLHTEWERGRMLPPEQIISEMAPAAS